MEYKILRGVLSSFLLELSLLQETAESIEATISAEIERGEEEMKILQPRLDAQWEAEEAQDIQNESRDPSELEIRYAELDELTWARNQHVKILRSALFLAAYAAFEQCLDGLAHEWRDAQGIQLRPADLRDQGIERSKAYLTKLVKMPFPSDTVEWGRICHLRTIRNQLAHDGPQLSEALRGKLRAALDAFPEIFDEKDQRVALTRDFMRDVFKVLTTFTGTLIARHEAFSDKGISIVE